jgi:hypothetical protein
MEPARQYTKGLESSAARSVLLTSTIRFGPLEGIGVFPELAPDSPWRRLDSRLFSRQLTVHSEAADSIWGGPKMVAREGVEPPTPAFSGLDSLGLNPFPINNLIRQDGRFIVTIL